MVCEHLQGLYQLCTTQQIRLSSSDLVYFVCRQCNSQDTCPSNLMEYGEYPFDPETEKGTDPDQSTESPEEPSPCEP